MKICKCCSEEKDFSQFGTNKKEKDGKNRLCLLCARKTNRIADEARKNRNTMRLQGLVILEKICTSCKTTKTATEFYSCIAQKDGLFPYCKLCDKKRWENRKKNRIHTILQEKKCKCCKQVKNIKEFRKHNTRKDGYLNECKLCKRILDKTKYDNDSLYRLRRIVRARIATYLRNKKTPSQNILGCSYKFYQNYLESLFLPGMTWENHGDWEIDHIIPLASGKEEETLIKLCHYTNTQPLWYDDNRSKGDKILIQQTN